MILRCVSSRGETSGSSVLVRGWQQPTFYLSHDSPYGLHHNTRTIQLANKQRSPSQVRSALGPTLHIQSLFSRGFCDSVKKNHICFLRTLEISLDSSCSNCKLILPMLHRLKYICSSRECLIQLHVQLLENSKDNVRTKGNCYTESLKSLSTRCRLRNRCYFQLRSSVWRITLAKR